VLHLDQASAFVLRTQVFAESFKGTVGNSHPLTDQDSVVHPWVMVNRAFNTYGDRPLLGEPVISGQLTGDKFGGSSSHVRWWSYTHCALAARNLASKLRKHCYGKGFDVAHQAKAKVVLICAPNSAGWLVTDWACAIANVPR
jgi:hypothetical protein